MKISTKSWHYRFLNTFDRIPYNPNLCKYVGSLLLLPFVLSLFLMVMVVAFPIWGPILLWLWGYDKSKKIKNMTDSIPTGFVKLGGPFWIFVEYIKAKKRKVCPFIEFTDD